MLTEVYTAQELDSYIESEKALLIYFSSENCNVCNSLKPKVNALIENEFPLMKSILVMTNLVPEAAGQHSIFTVPVILVFFLGKETIRKTRSFSVDELYHEISRSYSILFSE